jgi:hypothetical protein
MQNSSSPPIRWFVPASLFLSLVGWGGLGAVIVLLRPTVWPRWLFFFLGVLAITGTVLPAVAYLNRRFPSQPPVTPGAIVREALWLGIYFPTLAWLQIPRVLNLALAFLLALALILVEWLLRLREKSQWKP